MNVKKTIWALGVGVSSLIASSSALAADISTYDGPAINKSSPACLTIGDAISCSAPLLNYINGITPSTTETPTGYVVKVPQGTALDSFIVVASGGGAQGNADYGPSPFVVENGFKSNNAGSDSFFATGKANGTTVSVGNLGDPINNALPNAWDNPGTWDVSTQWLLDALTLNGVRRELMIGFDYNQVQNTATSLSYWALVTLRDMDGALSDINYEIRQVTGQSYSAFTTSYGFASQPKSTDFATVNGVTCIDTNGSEAQQFLPISGGQCPAGYEEHVDNAQSTESAEIIAFLPELNDRLEDFVKDYEVASVRIMFGCFGENQIDKNTKPGIGYLADEGTGGATNHCDNGGFGDVFLMAGAPMNQVPEPAMLALLGLALGALSLRMRGRSVGR